MLNVLYITNESENICGSTYSLADMLKSVDKEVVPYVLFSGKGRAFDYIESLGYQCYVVPFKLNNASTQHRYIKFVPRSILYSFINLKAIYKIKSIIEKNGISIVHSNSSVVTIGYKVAKICGVKHVWHIREFQDLDFGIQPMYGWRALKRMIDDSDATICITTAISNHFGLLNSCKNYVLNDAIRRKQDISCVFPKDKFFLFCGMVTENKGAFMALNIFRRFMQTHKEYKLLYVGKVSPDYKTYLQSKASEYSIIDNIEFLGFQYDVKYFFEKASALLMCSKNEAQGRVTVEALFYGCPVLGFNSGGTKEIIKDGVNGFLFNSEMEAFEKLECLVTDDELSKSLIREGHATATFSFSIEEYGKKLLLIYKSI